MKSFNQCIRTNENERTNERLFLQISRTNWANEWRCSKCKIKRTNERWKLMNERTNGILSIFSSSCF